MPERQPDQADGSWHLDKRVPVALIFAIVIQLGGIVWAISTSFERIEANTKNLNLLDNRVTTLDRSANSQAVQLGRIEEQISGLRADIGRLLQSIERQSR